MKLFRRLIFLPFICFFAFFVNPAAASPARTSPLLPSGTTTPVPIFTLPKKFTLCDEEIPLNRRHSREMFDREFTIVVYNRPQVILWLKRAPRYLPYFTRHLQKAGLPEDLKYLPVIESSLLEDIHSRAGAAGLWQFIKHTGRRFGLRINSVIDERLDPQAATQAAIRYLTFLHQEFGNWSLALAAYNCGEQRVAKELTRQRARNYFQLCLPRESERYLYRLAAIKLLLTQPRHYGFFIPPNQLYEPLPNRRVVLNFKVHYAIADFAEALGCSYHTLKKLNPQLISDRLPRGRFNLVLPAGCRSEPQKLPARLTPLPAASGPRFHRVKAGDTLGAISRRYHIPTQRLRKLNHLKNNTIYSGQRLRLRE